jgi:hypothetical protein
MSGAFEVSKSREEIRTVHHRRMHVEEIKAFGKFPERKRGMTVVI